MTWQEKMIARILLLIAGMLAGDSDLKNQLKYLSNTITQYHPEKEAA
jgi:hypothetical protein